MLSAIRSFAKSWVAAVLIGLLIISFAVFGITDVFRGHKSGGVIVAGSRTVQAADFRREFDDARRRAEQQFGQPVSAELAASSGLDRQILQALATRESFAGLLYKMGITPSDKLVAEQIAKIPAFSNPVTGRFDKQQYVSRLAQNELTTAKFEASISDDLAEQHLVAALMSNLLAPRAYASMAAVFSLESRDIGYLLVEPGSVPRPAAPTDAQLTAFMKENAAQLTQPEFRVLTVVHFSPQLVAPTVKVDEAEIRKRYDFRKDTLGTPETRTLTQIPVKDAAQAQAAAARLTKGEPPQAVAKSLGADAINYDNKPMSAIPDRKLATGAFKLQVGQVAAVQGDLGLAVVKVEAVTPGRTVSFEEARPQIEAELRKDAAVEKVYAQSQAYDDAHQKGANLAESAQKAGVAATTIGPLTKDGRGPDGQPVAGLSQKLVDTAFGLPSGGESEVVDAGGGEYFAVRVEKVIPPALPPFAAVKPQLAQAWTMRQLNQAMQAKAESLAARLRKGESLDAVSASAGVRVVQVPGVNRQNAQQNALVSPEIAAAAFGGKPKEPFVARARTFGYAVGEVEAIHAGDMAALAQSAEQMRPQMTSTIFRELGESAQASARRKMKVKVDYNAARAAIGLTPLDAKGQPEPPK